MKQLYVVPSNDDEFSLSWSPSTLNVGCMYFVTYIPTDVMGQQVQGSADLKKGDEVGEQCHARREEALGGTQYRNTVRKIGKYRTTVSKIDEISILHLFSVMFTYRVFVYLKHLCTSNHPNHYEEMWDNLEFSWFNDRKGCPTNFIVDYLSEIM